MTLEQQVCSLELAKKLKDLGVKQESYFRHVRLSDKPDLTEDWYILDRKPTDYIEIVSAFTVAELGEMLPDNFHTYRKGGDKQYWCGMDIKLYYIKDSDWWNHEEAPTEADARAKMLIYLLENNLTPASQEKE